MDFVVDARTQIIILRLGGKFGSNIVISKKRNLTEGNLPEINAFGLPRCQIDLVSDKVTKYVRIASFLSS